MAGCEEGVQRRYLEADDHFILAQILRRISVGNLTAEYWSDVDKAKGSSGLNENFNLG